jgi:hypothetical protein
VFVRRETGAINGSLGRLPLLRYRGCFAFESGRRITRLTDTQALFETLRLTDQQRATPPTTLASPGTQSASISRTPGREPVSAQRPSL